MKKEKVEKKKIKNEEKENKKKEISEERKYEKIKLLATIIAIILVLGLIAYVTNTIIKSQSFLLPLLL